MQEDKLDDFLWKYSEKCEKERLSAVQEDKIDDFLWKYSGKCEKERWNAVHYHCFTRKCRNRKTGGPAAPRVNSSYQFH